MYIKKALSDDESYVDIVSIYSSPDDSSLYNKILKKNSKKMPKNECIDSYTSLQIMLFNLWRKYILSISEQDILDSSNKIDFDIMPLIKFMSQLEDVSSLDEINMILNIDDKKLKTYMGRYPLGGFYPFKKQELDGWNYICSCDKSGNMPITKDAEYALSLNTSNHDSMIWVKLFIEECERLNIPYCIKYNYDDCYIDNIIFYTNNNYIKEHLMIINSIRNNNETLASNLGENTLLFSNIDKNIGFGKNLDYSCEKDILYIESVLKKIVDDEVEDHLFTEIETEIGNIPISKYISYQVALIINQKLGETLSSRKIKKIMKDVYSHLKYGIGSESFGINVCDTSFEVNTEILNNAKRRAARTIFYNKPELYSILKTQLRPIRNLNGIYRKKILENDLGEIIHDDESVLEDKVLRK